MATLRIQTQAKVFLEDREVTECTRGVAGVWACGRARNCERRMPDMLPQSIDCHNPRLRGETRRKIRNK